MGSSTLQTLQDPILLLSRVCFRAGGFPNPCQKVGWTTTQGLLAVHAVTATPWWLTIVGTTVLLRTAMIPITLHSMRATVQLSPIIQHCFGRCSSSRWSHCPPFFRAPSSVAANGAWDRPQQVSLEIQSGLRREGRGARGVAGAKGMRGGTPFAARLAALRDMRERAGAPHPLWMVASPLIQLPLFVTFTFTLRALAAMNPMPLDLVRPLHSPSAIPPPTHFTTTPAVGWQTSS
jgi:hypothetical protein